MISVVMATYNGAHTLWEVLSAFCRLEAPVGGWEIILVDNRSTDDTNEIIRSFKGRLPLTYLFEPRPGQNAARNTGLSRVSGDLVVFTDDDVLPQPNWLTQLRAAANLRRSFSIFGGPILPKWEVPPDDWVLKWVPLSPTFAILYPLPKGPIPPRRVFSPNMAIRSSVFLNGYRFDETIGPSGADYAMGSETELLIRLARAGYQAWHCRSAVVRHIVRKHHLSQDWILKRAVRFGRGQYRLAAMEFPSSPRRLRRNAVSLRFRILRQGFRASLARWNRDDERIFREHWQLHYLRGKALEAQTLSRGLAAHQTRHQTTGPGNSERPASRPRFPAVGVIALVPDKWENFWQTRHYLLAHLSRYFHVVWCNPPYTRKGLWTRDGFPPSAPEPDRAGFPGLIIYHPKRWLPQIGRPRLLGYWTLKARLRRARLTLLAKGCRAIVLYLWRPGNSPALDLIEHDLSCYHIDDEYTFSEVEQPTTVDEARLASRVGQLFIVSPALLEKKGCLNANVQFVPNGVNYSAFMIPRSEPEDLKAIPHPRIGYVGMIKPQLDLALLITLAKQRRHFSFIFVGPTRDDPEVQSLVKELSQLPNVYFLGAKPVSALPAYYQHMDVCIMCYKINGYTKFIYPLKLHECLASGSPVVGSRIPSLLDFAPLISLAVTPDEWSKALEDSLSAENRTVSKIEARRSAARQHDWDRLAQILVHSLFKRAELRAVQD